MDRLDPFADPSALTRSQRPARSTAILRGVMLVVGGLLLGFLLAELEVVRVFRPARRSTSTPLAGADGATLSAIAFIDGLDDTRSTTVGSACWTKSQLIGQLAQARPSRGDGGGDSKSSSQQDQTAREASTVGDDGGLPETGAAGTTTPAVLVPYQLPLFVLGGDHAFLNSDTGLRWLTVEGAADDTDGRRLGQMILGAQSDRVALTCARADLAAVAAALDQFLTRHPDWWVYAEPYEWLEVDDVPGEEQSDPDARRTLTADQATWGVARTDGDRPRGALQVQQLFGERQFPSSYGEARDCAQQRLWLYKEDVGRYYGSLLGVVASELALAFSNECQMVFWLDKTWYQIDVPAMCLEPGDGAARTAFLSEQNAGPDPWECLFMPLSECPASRFHGQVPQPPGALRAAGHAFQGPGGESVPFKEYSGLQADWVRSERTPPALQKLVDAAVTAGEPAVFEQCAGAHQTFNLWWRTALAKFLSRPNYRTRSAISRSLVHSLRESVREVDSAFQLHRLEDDQRHLCVAVHVRHGDKLKELAQGVSDRITFNHTLAEYLERAQPLLDAISRENGGRSAHTVLLMSDDPAVQAQAQRVNERFAAGTSAVRVLTLAGAGQPGELSPAVRNQQFFDLLASMELLSHCQGVVGNFDSNISALLYQLMAWRHQKCPHYFSYSGAPWRQLGKKR